MQSTLKNLIRQTSESYNGPLKVLPEGSTVEYLPIGSQEAPKTIIGKKISRPSNPKLHSQHSVQPELDTCLEIQ